MMRPIYGNPCEAVPLEPEEGRAYTCPCCGEGFETLYKDKWGDIVGCDNCIEELDADSCSYLFDTEDDDEREADNDDYMWDV